MSFDLRETTKRRALEQLVERCIENEAVLWRCMRVLTADQFAFDYDLRIVFYVLVGRLGKGTYDPATNRERLVWGLAALDAREDSPHPSEIAWLYRDRWWATLDEWYAPWTAVSEYVDALLGAVVDMNEIEAETAKVLRDNFAYAPLAVDALVDDAVWDRIRNAVMGRRALRFGKVAPALPAPPANAAAEWEEILARGKA